MKKYKKLPIVLIIIHTADVWIIYLLVVTSSDGHAGMIWLLFYAIDYPSGFLMFPMSSGHDIKVPLQFTFLGIIHWGLIGFVVSWIYHRIRNK